MISWEEAFTGKKPQAPSIPPSEVSTPPDAPPSPGVEPAPAREGIKETRPREYRKVIRKKATQAPPPTVARLSNRLEDIWVKITLESSARPQTVLICGAMQGEGCSFVSVHMALFLALNHHMQTLFVDTNVHTAKSIPLIPSTQDQPGLASFFTADSPLPDLVATTEYDNFNVLSSGAGAVQDQGQVIIEKEDIATLVTFCKENYDVAIFSGQTITFSPIMLEFAKAVDSVVLVCRYGSSRREVIRAAIDQLRDNNVNLTGLILNGRQYPVPQWVYRILK